MIIDIRRIAKLSRLRIDDDKLERFEKDMEAIVTMVDRLPDIDEELPLNPENAMQLRADEAVSNKFSRSELLANAPEIQAGCLVVPKTVE